MQTFYSYETGSWEEERHPHKVHTHLAGCYLCASTPPLPTIITWTGLTATYSSLRNPVPKPTSPNAKDIKGILGQKQGLVVPSLLQNLISSVFKSRAVMRETHWYNINHLSWKKILEDFVLSRDSSSRASFLPISVIFHPTRCILWLKST